MTKVLKYERLESNSENVLVRITEQSHRYIDFGNNGSTDFLADNGVCLKSHVYPEYYHGSYYVMGNEHSRDDNVIVFPCEMEFLAFEYAVKQYNIFNFIS